MEMMTIKEFKDKSNIEIIQELIKVNRGYITSKQLTELGIHRGYLKIMVDRGIIEKVTSGVYIDKNVIEDAFFTFQLRYPKTVYSGFTALYFYNLTEVYPSEYDITVPSNYHVDNINKNHNVIKCKSENFDIGITKVKTSLGYEVNVYDRERCICDLIRFRNKFDLEQVKKSVKMYVNDKNKDINKLREYSIKLNVYNDVMGIVGMYYE